MLVRLVRLPDGTVAADSAGRAAGRGAYVCPEPACIERALSRGRLGHAFRKPSEACLALAAAVMRVAGRDAEAVAHASADEVMLCEVSADSVGEVDVIPVRA
jgi:predicted RNA-binding protein YlxR (DUF448 family)